MGIGDVVESLVGGDSLNLCALSPELISKISGLITILKTAGIIFIGYIIFLLLRWIFTFKRYRITRKLSYKVDEIDRKLNILLRGRKVEIHKEKISKKEIEKKTKKIKKELKKINKKKNK